LQKCLFHPDNPPEQVEFISEILQANSLGGNVIFWSIPRNAPTAITTQIPIPGGTSDIINLLDELKEVFGLTDVFQELDVRIETYEVPSDSKDYLPRTNYLVLQHVCRFTDGTQVDVSGSRFYASIAEEHLVTLSSSYTPLDCIYPEGLLPESEIHQIYPGITSTIIKEILPPNAINEIPGGTYIYRFSTASTYYEVRANNGMIINSHPTKFYSYGFTRKIKDVTNSPELIKCEDTQPNLTTNSSGGASCSAPFVFPYNSIHSAVLPWNGNQYFNQLLGKSVNWGRANKLIIDMKYDTTTGTSSDALGYYNNSNGGILSFYRWANVSNVGLSGLLAKTRTVGLQNQPLPGLGGAVDLVAHEVGHGYIAAFLKSRDKNNSGKFASGSGAYKIASAITEGLADMFGKIAEAHVQYGLSNCSLSNPPTSNCGQSSSILCGSIACKNGEYCQNNQCKPCRSDCPTQTPAIINWEFATKYPDGEKIFTVDDVYGRKIWDENLWGIDCHWDGTATDNSQVYGNSIWLSGLISSYSTAEDPLFGNKMGFIRNIYDVIAIESVLRQTLKHIPGRPSAYEAFSAYAAGLLFYIKVISLDAWNSSALQRAAGIALNSSKSWRSTGKCQDSLVANICNIDPKSCCTNTSRYICTRK